MATLETTADRAAAHLQPHEDEAFTVFTALRGAGLTVRRAYILAMELSNGVFTTGWDALAACEVSELREEQRRVPYSSMRAQVLARGIGILRAAKKLGDLP